MASNVLSVWRFTKSWPGFSYAVNDRRDNSLQIYAVTEVPRELADAFRDAGVETVVVRHQSLYGWQQLQAASSEAIQLPGVLTAGPASRGDGIRITTTLGAAGLPTTIELPAGTSVPIVSSRVDRTQTRSGRPPMNLSHLTG